MTADQVVVIGKGRLDRRDAGRASSPPATRGATSGCARRSSISCGLPSKQAGASVSHGKGRPLHPVRGMSEEPIGEIAWRHSIMLHELAPQSASLEEAFIESTEGEARVPRRPARTPSTDAMEGGA